MLLKFLLKPEDIERKKIFLNSAFLLTLGVVVVYKVYAFSPYSNKQFFSLQKSEGGGKWDKNNAEGGSCLNPIC